MGSRAVPFQSATGQNTQGSRARSVQSYYPFYPPPLYPTGLEASNSNFGVNPPATSSPPERAAVVKRNNLRWGDVSRYTHGNTAKRIFHMTSTGRVESSLFQPLTNMPSLVQFNMFLYRAGGYPQNLGLSEKVPTLPQGTLGNQPSQMGPRQQITRTVFTRRAYASAPSINAQPTQK